MDFTRLLAKAFEKTGIYPFSYEKVLSLIPREMQAAAPVMDFALQNEERWRLHRDNLRNMGFSDSVIQENMRSLLLKTQGKSDANMFAEELANIAKFKKNLEEKDLDAKHRGNPNQFGEVLSHTRLAASLEERKQKQSYPKKTRCSKKNG